MSGEDKHFTILMDHNCYNCSLRIGGNDTFWKFEVVFLVKPY